MDRVADVRGPVGDGSLLRGNGLHNESEPRAHGEAAVLELLDLELLKVLRLGESERVEAASRVDVSHSQLREGVLHDARAVALRESNGEDLDDDDVPEGREAAALRRERSDGTREDEVRALVRRAELASLEPRHARAHLGAPRSRDSEHGPASVDDFALGVLGVAERHDGRLLAGSGVRSELGEEVGAGRHARAAGGAGRRGLNVERACHHLCKYMLYQ